MPEDLSTTLNKFLVGAGSEKIIVMMPVNGRAFPREDAINLAVWLVACANSCPPYGDAKADFDALYERVSNT